jgi:hypothetical protein
MFRIAFVAGILCAFAATASAAPPELNGRWSGYWVSDKSGHTGPLHGKFVQLDSETYRVRFHGRFAKIIPFVYSTKLHVEGTTEDTVVLSANQNLGPFLGTFQTSALATATSFDASFTARSDSGRFVLSRRR